MKTKGKHPEREKMRNLRPEDVPGLSDPQLVMADLFCKNLRNEIGKAVRRELRDRQKKTGKTVYQRITFEPKEMTTRELWELLLPVIHLAEKNRWSSIDLKFQAAMVVLYALQGALEDGSVEDLAEFIKPFTQAKMSEFAKLAGHLLSEGSYVC